MTLVRANGRKRDVFRLTNADATRKPSGFHAVNEAVVEPPSSSGDDMPAEP